jgi:hypothetical protein
MSSRKRKAVYQLVDIRSLPEISTLDPDSLKEFTKDELLSYLVHFGIEPADTKPNMKRQMRALIMALRAGEKNPAAVVPSGRKAVNMDQKDISNISNQNQNTIPNAFPSATPKENGSLSDSYFCVRCRNKKANKDCKYHCCKPCCNALSQNCTVHSRNLSVAPGTRYVSVTAMPSSIPSSSPSQSSLSSSVPVQTSNSVVNTLPTREYVPPVFKEIESEADENSTCKVNLCPRCGREILSVGSNFLIHLRQCDPQTFLSYIKDKLRRSNDDGKHIASETTNHNPIDVARQRALQRLKRNMNFMSEIFAPTSVDSIANNIKSLNEQTHSLATNLLQRLQCLHEELIRFQPSVSLASGVSLGVSALSDTSLRHQPQSSRPRSELKCLVVDPRDTKIFSKIENCRSKKRILLFK